MNNFNYQDEVYYLDHFGNIKNGLFSENWEYGYSYLIGGESIETKKLFKTKKELLLNMFKEKENSIKVSQSLISRLQRELPGLYEDLTEIQNKINKESKNVQNSH